MIFISAGHHAKMPGASYDGFNEFDEATIWSDKLCGLLGDKAIQVPTGVLREKVDFINHRDPSRSIAVEIHFNAAKDSDGNNIGKGCETLYYPGSVYGKQIATVVNNAMAEIFSPDRGAKEGYYRMNPKNGPDFFLAKTKCPAIIIEPEFIHRKKKIVENRTTACEALAEAFVRAHKSIYGG